jgi:signal transduction histidine kinase
VSSAANALWLAFLSTALAVAVLVAALAVAMIIGQRRLVALHRAYTRRLLAAHEEERAWVAREVHDDAVQRLAVLHHELHELHGTGNGLSPAQRRHLEGITGEVEDLSASLRQLAHRLHPAAIEQLGLAAALQQLAGEVARTSGLRIDVKVPPAGPRLPVERTLALFRIAQEALNTAVRHSGASSVSVAVDATNEEVEMRIEDDGRGFDTAVERTGGIGLIGMRERATLAGGRAMIRSRPGGGTLVAVTVPVQAGP